MRDPIASLGEQAVLPKQAQVEHPHRWWVQAPYQHGPQILQAPRSYFAAGIAARGAGVN